MLKPCIYNYSIIRFPILYAKNKNLKTPIDSNWKKKTDFYFSLKKSNVHADLLKQTPNYNWKCCLFQLTLKTDYY